MHDGWKLVPYRAPPLRVIPAATASCAPVLLGEGMRLFGPLDDDAVELTPVRVVDAPDATHVRYRVDGPATLIHDDRGAGSTVRTNDDHA